MCGPANVGYANVTLEHGEVAIFDCVLYLPDTLAYIQRLG